MSFIPNAFAGYNRNMSYIDVTDELQAQGDLAKLYQRFANLNGNVDNVLKVHSVNPQALKAHSSLYVQCMHRPSPVSRIEREMVAVTVSLLNHCHY